MVTVLDKNLPRSCLMVPKEGITSSWATIVRTG